MSRSALNAVEKCRKETCSLLLLDDLSGSQTENPKAFGLLEMWQKLMPLPANPVDISKSTRSREQAMSERKMVSRSVVVALGIICIILIACLGGAMAYYTLAIGDRDNTITSKNNQIYSLNSNVTNLQNQNKQLQTWLNGNETLLNQTETWLDGNITYYNSQITNLQNQLKTFQRPILGFSNLTAEDNRTNPNNPFLQVQGAIHNFGINGTLASLYVKAYHNDGSVALETERIQLSDFLDIDGQSSINVNLSYYYNGSALASWTIVAEEIYII